MNGPSTNINDIVKENKRLSSDDVDMVDSIINELNNLDVSAVLVRPDKYISDTAKTEEEVTKLAMLEMPKPISNIKEREITI